MSSIEKLFKEIKLGLDYSSYGLEYNPFPAAGVAPEVTRLEDVRRILEERFCESVREDVERQVVERYIKDAYKGKAAHTWIMGEWRVGKSLMLVRLWLLTRENIKDTIAIYIPKPRYGFIKSIYSYFIREYLGTDLFEELSDGCASLIIEKYFDQVIDKDWFQVWKKTVKGKKEDLLKMLKEREIRPIDIIDGIKVKEYNARAKAELTRLGVVSEKIIGVLTDYQLDSREREAALLELGRAKPEVLEDHLVSLFKAAIIAGYKIIYCFLDDVEDMLREWSRLKSEREAARLSSLLGRGGDNLSILGTQHPDMIMVFVDRFPRLAGRAGGDPLNFRVIKLGALKQLKDTCTVVSHFLSKARKKDFVAPYETYPFKEDAVEFLHKHFGGTLGHMMPSFQRLLDEGVKKGFVEIDKSFIEDMLKKVKT